MKSRLLVILYAVGLFSFISGSNAQAQAPLARPLASQSYVAQDWARFRHYPYVYYTQNFKSPEMYRSANDLYYRYPRYMQVPAFNPYWQNYYPVPRRFHEGKHFVLDVF